MLTRRNFTQILGAFGAALATTPGSAWGTYRTAPPEPDLSGVQESLEHLVSDWSFRQHPLPTEGFYAKELNSPVPPGHSNAYYVSSAHESDNKPTYRWEDGRYVEGPVHHEGEHLAAQFQVILEHSGIAEKGAHLWIFLGAGFSSYLGTVVTSATATFVVMPKQADRDIFVIASNEPVASLENLPRENAIRMVVGHTGERMTTTRERHPLVYADPEKDYGGYVPRPRYEPRRGFTFVSKKSALGHGWEYKLPTDPMHMWEPHWEYGEVKVRSLLPKDEKVTSQTWRDLDYARVELDNGMAAVYTRLTRKTAAELNREPDYWELLGFEMPV